MEKARLRMAVRRHPSSILHLRFLSSFPGILGALGALGGAV
jgi:hypothetical protein